MDFNMWFWRYVTYARVAQWWSIALPRRGSRVRIPSRALKEIEKESSDGWLFFLCSSPAGLERFECLRSTPVVAVERLILALMKWLWILPGLRCPYSRCQFPGCGSCPSDRWQYGQWSSRQTHARYMESIQEFWQLNPLCQRKGWKWILPLLCQFQQAEERLKSSVHFLKDLLGHVGIQQPIVFGSL